jgi:hypothetical protein
MGLEYSLLLSQKPVTWFYPEAGRNFFAQVSFKKPFRSTIVAGV